MKKIILDFSKPIENIKVTENTVIYGLFFGVAHLTCQNSPSIVFSKNNISLDINVKAVINANCVFDFSPILKVSAKQKGIVANLRINVLNNSSNSIIKSTPAMEIKQPDVSVSHSLAISSFDKNQLTYLCSRCLNKKEAEQILINSFISDIMKATKI